MPQQFTFACAGMAVGLERRGYDFQDDDGRQVVGESVVLVVSEGFDAQPLAVKIPGLTKNAPADAVDLQAAINELPAYSPVEVEGVLYPRIRQQQAFIEPVARRILSVDPKSGKRTDIGTGEVLADPSQQG